MVGDGESKVEVKGEEHNAHNVHPPHHYTQYPVLYYHICPLPRFPYYIAVTSLFSSTLPSLGIITALQCFHQTAFSTKSLLSHSHSQAFSTASPVMLKIIMILLLSRSLSSSYFEPIYSLLVQLQLPDSYSTRQKPCFVISFVVNLNLHGHNYYYFTIILRQGSS